MVVEQSFLPPHLMKSYRQHQQQIEQQWQQPPFNISPQPWKQHRFNSKPHNPCPSLSKYRQPSSPSLHGPIIPDPLLVELERIGRLIQSTKKQGETILSQLRELREFQKSEADHVFEKTPQPIVKADDDEKEENEKVGLPKGFEDVLLDEKDPLNMTDNLLNEDLGVALPNGESQKKPRNEEKEHQVDSAQIIEGVPVQNPQPTILQEESALQIHPKVEIQVEEVYILEFEDAQGSFSNHTALVQIESEMMLINEEPTTSLLYAIKEDRLGIG